VGFLDVLTGGRRKLKQPAPDRLFAMATAGVKLEIELGLRNAGTGALVFQPLATADFDSVVKEMEEVVRSTGGETGTAVETHDDRYGYRWMVMRDPDLEDLVVGANGVSSALQGSGYGDRLLAAVFAFRDEAGKGVYWIYNFKRGAFYPFVPAAGEQARDSERELRLKAQIGMELPVEQDLSRWFPLWDIPI
jgi:hypothetical protein